jgi:hypothetical protein
MSGRCITRRSFWITNGNEDENWFPRYIDQPEDVDSVVFGAGALRNGRR